MATIPVAILVRVSTDSQETSRQVHELTQVAEEKGWEVVMVVEEKISGAAESRAGLDQIRAMAGMGEIQKVLVHEVSRIARRNSVAHDFLEYLTKHGVSLYWHAQRIETLLPGGKTNPAAMVMFALLSEFSRAERELLAERTRSGLAAARRRGVRLGRTPGITEDPKEFLAKYPEVIHLARLGKSVRDIKARTGVSPNTIQKVKAMMDLRAS